MAKSISKIHNLSKDRTVTSVGWKQESVTALEWNAVVIDRQSTYSCTTQTTASCMVTVLPVSGCINSSMYSVSMAMY